MGHRDVRHSPQELLGRGLGARAENKFHGKIDNSRQIDPEKSSKKTVGGIGNRPPPQEPMNKNGHKRRKKIEPNAANGAAQILRATICNRYMLRLAIEL